jgi:tetratricopeptide (TPR) repeat protein
MGFDSSSPQRQDTGFDARQIVSHEKHFSPFVCGICIGLVSLDCVVATCCSHPYCRKCLERVVKECSEQQRQCRCPGCQTDLHSNGDEDSPTPAEFMLLASDFVNVRPLHESQPLAYRVLCQVQVRCASQSSEGCSWVGDYEKYLSHAISHTAAGCLSPAGKRRNRLRTVAADSSHRGNGLIETHHSSEKESIRKLRCSLNESEHNQSLGKLQSPETESSDTKLRLSTNDSSPTLNNESFEVDWNDSRASFPELGDGNSDNIEDAERDSNSGSNHRDTFKKADRLKKQANAKFNKGDLAEAQKLYTEGIDAMKKMEPSRNDDFKLLSNMHSNRAATFYREKKFDECIRDCEYAIEYEPKMEKPWIRKRRALAASGDFDAAHTFLHTALSELPQSTKIQEEFNRSKAEMEAFVRAKGLMEKNQIQDAWVALQPLVETCETVAMLSFVAKVAIAADESNKALEIVNKILSMNPRSVDGLELRGVWYFLSGDTEHATKVLADACTRIQTSTQLQGALLRVQRTHAAYSEARLAVKEDRYMEAIEQFTIAIKTSSPLPRLSPLFAALRTGRSESHLLAHQYLQALKDCQEVVTVRREYAPAWIVRSEVLIALGKVQDARNELSLARRTWGAGNPIIEEGYKRADFEFRVLRVDAEITVFQSELDEGNTERLPRLENTKAPGHRERSQKLKHRSGSVRNLNVPKQSALSHHRSFSGISCSFDETQSDLPRIRAAKAKDDKPPRQRAPRVDSNPAKRIDDNRTDRRDRASAATSKDRSRSVSAGRQPRHAADGNASQQLRIEKSHQSDDDVGAGRQSDKARSSERYRRPRAL